MLFTIRKYSGLTSYHVDINSTNGTQIKISAYPVMIFCLSCLFLLALFVQLLQGFSVAVDSNISSIRPYV